MRVKRKWLFGTTMISSVIVITTIPFVVSMNSIKEDLQTKLSKNNLLKKIESWKNKRLVLSFDDLLKRNDFLLKIKGFNGSIYERTLVKDTLKSISTINNPIIYVDGIKYEKIDRNSLSLMSHDEKKIVTGNSTNGYTPENSPIKIGAVLTLPDNSQLIWRSSSNGALGWCNQNGDLKNVVKLLENLWNHESTNHAVFQKFDDSHYFVTAFREKSFYVNKEKWIQVSVERSLFGKNDNVHFSTIESPQKAIWKKDNVLISKKTATNDLKDVLSSYWNLLDSNKKVINSIWKPINSDLSKDINPKSFTLTDQHDFLKFMANESLVILGLKTQMFQNNVKLRRMLQNVRDALSSFEKLSKDNSQFSPTTYFNLLKEYKKSLDKINLIEKNLNKLKTNFKHKWKQKIIDKNLPWTIESFSLLYPNKSNTLIKNLHYVLRSKSKEDSLIEFISQQKYFVETIMRNQLIDFRKKVISQHIETRSLKLRSTNTFKSFLEHMDHLHGSKTKEYAYSQNLGWIGNPVLTYTTADGAHISPVSSKEIENWNKAHPNNNYWYSHRDKSDFAQNALRLTSNSALDYFTQHFALGDIRELNKGDSNPLLSHVYNNIHFTKMSEKTGYALTYSKQISPNVSMQLIPEANANGSGFRFRTGGYVPFLEEYKDFGRPINSFAKFILIGKNGHKFKNGIDVNMGEVDKNNKPIKSSILVVTKAVLPNDKKIEISFETVANKQLDRFETNVVGHKVANNNVKLLEGYNSGKNLYALWNRYHDFEDYINRTFPNKNISNMQQMKIFKKKFASKFSDGVKPELIVTDKQKVYFHLSISTNGEQISKRIYLDPSIKDDITNSVWNKGLNLWDGNTLSSNENINNNLKKYPWFPEVITKFNLPAYRGIVHPERQAKYYSFITNIETKLQNGDNKHTLFRSILAKEHNEWKQTYTRNVTQYYNSQKRESLASGLGHLINSISGRGYDGHTTSAFGAFTSAILSSLPGLGEATMLLQLTSSIASIVEEGATAENILHLGTNTIVIATMIALPLVETPSFESGFMKEAGHSAVSWKEFHFETPEEFKKSITSGESQSKPSTSTSSKNSFFNENGKGYEEMMNKRYDNSWKGQLSESGYFDNSPKSAKMIRNLAKLNEHFEGLSSGELASTFESSKKGFVASYDVDSHKTTLEMNDIELSNTYEAIDWADIDLEEHNWIDNILTEETEWIKNYHDKEEELLEGATGTSQNTQQPKWLFKDGKWIDISIKEETINNNNFSPNWIKQDPTTKASSQLQPNSTIKLGILGGGNSQGASSMPKWTSDEFYSEMNTLGAKVVPNDSPWKTFEISQDALLGNGWIADQITIGGPKRDVVINPEVFDMINHLKLSDRSLTFLKNSKPGNMFTGVINFKKGVIEIHPLVPRAENVLDPAGVTSQPYTGPYSFKAFDSKPILHRGIPPTDSNIIYSTKLADASQAKTSHGQLLTAVDKMIETRMQDNKYRQGSYLGISFFDIGTPGAMRETSGFQLNAIAGQSRTINTIQDNFWATILSKPNGENVVRMEYGNNLKNGTWSNIITASSANSEHIINGAIPNKILNAISERFLKLISNSKDFSLAQKERLMRIFH